MLDFIKNRIYFLLWAFKLPCPYFLKFLTQFFCFEIWLQPFKLVWSRKIDVFGNDLISLRSYLSLITHKIGCFVLPVSTKLKRPNYPVLVLTLLPSVGTILILVFPTQLFFIPK